MHLVKTTSPEVSIVIVTWNSATHIPRCLTSLRNQTFQDFEVIVVDNGSTDDTLNVVQEYYANLDIMVEKIGINSGFSVANNIGARLARGKWLALLNADAFPEPYWLENLLQAAEANPEYSFFASRQIQENLPTLLDGAGDVYHLSGLAWRQYYNKPANQYGLQSGETFGACAAAALYRRDDFLEVGGFDESFFSYFEDVDLSFRLRLAGGRCLYVPQAVVHHVGSASKGKTSDFAYYYVHRNMIWTFFKNMPALLFWYCLPIHVLFNIYLTLSFLIKERRVIVLKAKLDALRGLPSVLRARKKVQQSRKAKLRDLYLVMNKGILSPRHASHSRNSQHG